MLSGTSLCELEVHHGNDCSVNRSGEMEVFVRPSSSAAAFRLPPALFRMTPSAVSKLVARLEA
jgi:hypothetical protein